MLRPITKSATSLSRNPPLRYNALVCLSKLDKRYLRAPSSSSSVRHSSTYETIRQDSTVNDSTLVKNLQDDDPGLVAWTPVPVQEVNSNRDVDYVPYRNERSKSVRPLDTRPYIIQQPKKKDPYTKPLKGLNASTIPTNCPGCGAASQTSNSDVPGFYQIDTLNTPNTSTATESSKLRKQAFLDKKAKEEAIFDQIISGLDKEVLDEMNVLEPDHVPDVNARNMKEFDKIIESFPQQQEETEQVLNSAADPTDANLNIVQQPPDSNQGKPLLCTRCHSLLHHHVAPPIATVNYASITQPISECKYSRIHIYHVIDAADFPMSLLPNIKRNILRHLPSDFRKHRLNFSFIVTRADLLMAKEVMVTKLMTYFRTVLKEVITDDDNIGDIRVVSAKQTWTTEKIKEDIRKQKGGVFLIGRTNVGKSRLFDSIYPRKSSMAKYEANAGAFGRGDGVEMSSLKWPSEHDLDETFEHNADEGISAILQTTKPAEPFKYPEMPTVSDIPGTTVGPIKVEIGNGMGELVDLPGLERGKLFDYVRPECIKSMIMTQRITPEQCVVKPEQCLILGGIIKMTSVTPDVTFLAYPFLTLPPHVTSLLKAPTYLNHPEPASNPILFNRPESEHLLASAGNFTLSWEVTHARNAKLKNIKKGIVEKLPYRIYSADILVEGCGWVEVVAQMRLGQEPPVIEVSSPMGLGIGIRMPMGAQMLNTKPVKRAPPGARPRKSMKGEKKRTKWKKRMEKLANSD